jgi:hypothetical protein
MRDRDGRRQLEEGEAMTQAEAKMRILAEWRTWISVMVLRNAHPDATRFSAALSMIEIFRSG